MGYYVPLDHPLNRRKDDRRRIERRAAKPGSNVRYEDKDQPQGWEPKRIRRGRQSAAKDDDILDAEEIG